MSSTLNHSGFNGYGMANLYPQFGGGTQSLATNPTDDENAVMDVTTKTIETPTEDQTGSVKKNFWILFIGLIILILFFGLKG